MYGRPKSRFIEILFVGLSVKPGGHGGDPRVKRVRKSSSTAHVVLARLRKIVLLQKDCVPSELKITCLYLLVKVFIKAMNVLVVSLEVSSVLS